MFEQIGFLGCGNMGGAIARAVCRAAAPSSVYLANRTAAKAQALAAQLGCRTADNRQVAADCQLIFLAVKPQMMEQLLQYLLHGRIALCCAPWQRGFPSPVSGRWPAGTGR